jgi:hypothetical protein
MSVDKFSAIFDGLKEAYGTFKIEKKQANGKNIGRAGLVRQPRTMDLWEKHLQGTFGIGIIPINEDNSCRWGCIDIDQYPLDHKALVDNIAKLEFPMVVCRSKSGGAHCFLFTKDWVPAVDMQKTLQHISAALGYSGSEIFPKQIKLHLDRGDVGNFLNLPYFDAEDGLRYAIKEDGSSATLEEFFELYDQRVIDQEQLLGLQSKEKVQEFMKDGPPCLQILCQQKISEGGRNNGLFNLGVYLRKAFPDSYETEILTYNATYLAPPLPLNEVNLVAKQLDKKDYAYKCTDAPINAHCNKDLCRTRKHGVGVGTHGAPIANLRKYNSVPPVWFLDVNGEPLELDTDALLSQAVFQKACMEQLNFMPPTSKKIDWEARISCLLNEMKEDETAVIEVAQDASTSGQFYDFLDEFCHHQQKAQDKEEILLRRPWVDEDKNLTFFRLKDFEAHLRKNKFFEYKSHKIAQRLRDINGESTVLKIKGRAVRVWAVPFFNADSLELKSTKFNSGEPPF